MEKKGDLGLVAQSSKGKQTLFGKPQIHTVNSIFEALKSISQMRGNQVFKLVVINVDSLKLEKWKSFQGYS